MTINYNALVSVVEDMLVAISDGDYITGDVIQAAKDALGYDPTVREQDYLVSLSIDIEALTPEEAVKKFVALIEDNLDWVYTVTDSEGKSYELDTYHL